MQPGVPAYNPDASVPRPYVRFDRRPIETRVEGQSHFEDRDWVELTAPGSRDTVELLVDDWLQKLHDHAKAKRVPPAWPHEYTEAYKSWQRTQEQPLTGTGLKNWPAISPAQRENCLRANILTVEDLATANSEALNRIGMGSVGLKQMAESWLREQKGAGGLAAQLQSLSIRLAELEDQNSRLREANLQLAAKEPSKAVVLKA
jgi:hypothetical protein